MTGSSVGVIHEVVYESGEDVAYRELGFETRDGAYEGFIGDAEPSSARIIKIQKKNFQLKYFLNSMMAFATVKYRIMLLIKYENC